MHEFPSFRPAAGLLALWLPCASAVSEELPRSPASDPPRPGVVRAPLPSFEIDGLPLALVFFDLKGASGVTGGDEVARERIEKALALRAGSPFSTQAAEAALQRVRALDFVRSAAYRLYESDRAGHVVMALTIELGPKERDAGPKGMLAGNAADFPILYQDERMLLRLLFDGGIGFYNEFNPWFGNAPAFTGRSPIALNPADGERATWSELSAKYGLAGISRLGDSPFWLYGAGSLLTSFSSGQDLFRSDTRDRTLPEDLYAGLIFNSPGSEWAASISAGRQNWQVHDGFLFSRFAAGANAGPYPALYLNPRTAYEMTFLGQVKWKNLRLEAFHVDPAEIDFLDSGTTYAGAHLSYAHPGGTEASLLFYEVPESDTVFANGTAAGLRREGLQTLDLRLGSSTAFGIPGLELFGEHAWQSHRDADVDASAWYLRGGYTFSSLPWKPNLGYRYASFSGDDPATPAFERFDAQLSSGLDTWVQGVNAKKVIGNSNLNSHRIRLNLAPTSRLSLTFDAFWLTSAETRGASDLARELDLGIRWSISEHLYFLGVTGIAFPGDALRQQAGGKLDNWTTAQASLFWFF